MNPKAFIKAHTQVLPVPSLPEIRLWQASEVTPLWTMTEAMQRERQLAPPFWAFPWAGGQALALFLRDHPDIVAGRRVLDLACGSGLVGIAAARAGAARVICNDIDPMAGAAVALNTALNAVTLDYLDGDILSGEPPEVEVVLAGDIAYERGMRDTMLTFLRRVLDKGCDVYVGDPHRTYFPDTGFERCALYEVETSADIEDRPVKPASVWRLMA